LIPWAFFGVFTNTIYKPHIISIFLLLEKWFSQQWYPLQPRTLLNSAMIKPVHQQLKPDARKLNANWATHSRLQML
jgi:hypothetical protein